MLTICSGCAKDSQLKSSTSGKGGSTARFTISGGYLYVVDGDELHTFSLQNPAEPEMRNSLQLGWNNTIETIFPWKDKLFIGSKDAMYIISISNPEQPTVEGTASHIRACDPVVADDKYAYVTVRTGNNCSGNINALYVYDVSAGIESPSRVFEQDLDNPHGLGLHNQYLYVCDGASGLKVFDLQNAGKPKQVVTKTGHTFFDCIPTEDVLVCMIEGGMVLYNISTPSNPVVLSEIIN
ncbi:MAG: hypothetical protein IT249_13900 [Chitinophagaceae bacterium]|nr:hypothetical protein [Chitinophagaceae bacterium]